MWPGSSGRRPTPRWPPPRSGQSGDKTLANLELIKGTGKTSSGASNIHFKKNFTKQTYTENWHRRNFCVLSSFETIGEPILYMES